MHDRSEPANTLYDSKSRTTKLVDLGELLRDIDVKACKMKYIKEITPVFAAPEIRTYSDGEMKVDLIKSLSWTIEYMIEENLKHIENKEIKLKLQSLSNQLKDKVSSERISLEKGLEILRSISDHENESPSCASII